MGLQHLPWSDPNVHGARTRAQRQCEWRHGEWGEVGSATAATSALTEETFSWRREWASWHAR
jgi:hypothetical protein